MRHKQLKLSLFLLLGLGLPKIQAQESMDASGGNASGTGGSASFSMGQLVNQTYLNSNGSMAEGVQQPFEISVVTTIKDVKDLNLQVSVYPNPTADFIQLKVENEKIIDLYYQLYDNNGRILQNGVIKSNLTEIFMGNLIPASYYLKVMKNNQELELFKIIKTR